MREGKGDADVGVGVNEICGAINGVDDERWSGGEGAACGGFFAKKTEQVGVSCICLQGPRKGIGKMYE